MEGHAVRTQNFRVVGRGTARQSPHGQAVTTVPPDGPRPRLQVLELHLSHACNLACTSCTHFSNYNHKGNLSLEEGTRWLETWSPRLQPPVLFALLGGEPALNPQLTEFVRAGRKAFPDTRMILVTNGFLLHKHPELPRALAEYYCELHVSVHHDSEAYYEKLRPVVDLVANWQDEFARLRVTWRESAGKWYRQYRGEGQDMRPWSDGNPEQSWQACRSKWCVQLHNGKLWKCPTLAYLPMQSKVYNLNSVPEWQPYLTYQPLSSDCTDQELDEFVTRGCESYCAMCPAEPELFELSLPFRGHLGTEK